MGQQVGAAVCEVDDVPEEPAEPRVVCAADERAAVEREDDEA